MQPEQGRISPFFRHNVCVGLSEQNPRTPKLGMFSWFGLKLPLKERLQLIRDAGFEATTLWWGVERSDNAETLGEAPAIVRDLGLYLENIHVPYDGCADIWSDSATTRAHIAGRYLRWIEDCHTHAIPVLVTHISRTPSAPGPTAAGLALISDLLENARQAGVVIAIENTRRADYLQAIFTELDSAALGFCFDTSHNWLWTKEARLLRDFGSRLACVHLSDTVGALDRHWLPGEGAVDWKAVAADFPRPYHGCLTLEVAPKDRRHTDAAAFVRRAYQQAIWVRDSVACPVSAL
ncbi:MAG: sugar phosphate isomerase/epimerase [Armatimonadetes bacterium]|nr:sugar phosphate isomerase/epimerase [Armatimonadota bacterium]